MHKKFGNHWVEYRDPIDLMDRPSNREIIYVGTKKESTTSELTILQII